MLKKKFTLSPMMAFIVLTLITIILSGILGLFHFQAEYSTVNPVTNELSNTVVEVESLFSLSGLKYIVTHAVSDFVSFAPLSMLLIILIGVGMLEGTGFLKTALTLLTKNISKNTLTFLLILTCIISSLVGDVGFVILLPIGALLFKYGKRNPLGGIIATFASLSFGYGINIFLNSIDSNLLDLTLRAAKLLDVQYSISVFFSFIIMIAVLLATAFAFTKITEKTIMPSLPKYELEEELFIITKKELRGLIVAIGAAIVYILIIIYNIIPGLPLSGALLDHGGTRYIDMLFGSNSLFSQGFVFIITFLFFIVGLSYGLVTRSIKTNKDLTKALSYSLDEIGSVIVLLFFASLFISVFKNTNIGLVITAALTGLLTKFNFTGLGLIIVFLFIVLISNLFSTSSVIKWSIISGVAVPIFMNASIAPEFAQIIFNAGDSITNGITPLFAYFVIYLAFLEKYSVSESMTMRKSIKYMIPYSVTTFVIWFVVLIGWYITGIPLGIGSFPSITYNL